MTEGLPDLEKLMEINYIKLHQQNNEYFFLPVAGGRENQFYVFIK